MATNIFRYYVIAASPSDVDDEDVTHVAIELRPSAVSRLVLIDLVTRLAHAALDWMCAFYHLEVSFQETTWLNFNPVDEDFPEEWEAGAIEAEIDPTLIAERGLTGRSVNVSGDAWLIFTCFHKHSGTEYISREIDLRSLVKAVRLSDVIAELDERFGKSHLPQIFAGGAA